MKHVIDKSLDSLYVSLGQQIRDARQQSSMTQEQLASALGLSRTSITNIEKGRQHVLVHTLYAIAHVLELNVRELLPEVENTRGSAQTPLSMPQSVTPREWGFISPLMTQLETKKRERTRQRTRRTK